MKTRITELCGRPRAADELEIPFVASGGMAEAEAIIEERLRRFAAA